VLCWNQSKRPTICKEIAQKYFETLGIAHKILRYKVKKQKQKIIKKITKCRKNILAHEAE